MKEITCIICNIGCRITIDNVDGRFVLSENKCPKGIEFAKKEMTHPVRSLTTTVRTIFPEKPVLPVKTKGKVPKKKIPEILDALSKLVITDYVCIGETVVINIMGTGCDVIATCDLK